MKKVEITEELEKELIYKYTFLNLSREKLNAEYGIDKDRLKRFFESKDIYQDKYKLNQPQKDFIIEKKKEGWGVERIKKELPIGFSPSHMVISEFLKSINLNTEKNVKFIPSEEELNTYITMFDNGQTLEEMYHVYKRTKSVITEILKENNRSFNKAKPLSEEEKSLITKHFNNGVSKSEISRITNRDYSTIDNFLNKNNVENVKRSDDENKVLNLHSQGLNSSDIQRRTGFSIKKINKIILDNNLEINYKITPINETEINYVINNYGDKTITELSEELNRDVRTISNILEKNNKQIVSNPNKFGYTAEQLENIIQLKTENKKSNSEIGKMYDVSHKTIEKVLKTNNVEYPETPNKIEINNELCIIIKYLVENENFTLNNFANLLNVSLPTIKKYTSNVNYINLDTNKENIINLLIKYNDTFKNIKDLLQYEIDNNIKNYRTFTNNVTKQLNISKSTLVACCEYIYDEFNWMYDEAIEQYCYHLYYNENQSLVKIGSLFGCKDGWVRTFFNKNNWIRDNKYSYSVSESEKEISDYVVNNFKNTILSDRKILNGKEIDILYNNIGIEYNGLYFHSIESGKTKKYHLDKTELANSKGFKLIHIFEDEYKNNKELVLQKINYLLGGTSHIENKIHARKCVIKIVNNSDSNDLLNDNHIQGQCNSTIRYGAYYNDELVSVMCFSKISSYHSFNNENSYELTRFCVKNNTVVNGIANRLIKQFILDYRPSEIISFADRRWTLDKDNNIYTKLGFELDNIGKPNYFWCKNGNRYKSYNFKKSNIMKRKEFDNILDKDNKTEVEIMNEAGYVRVYDCGLFRYKLKINNQI